MNRNLNVCLLVGFLSSCGGNDYDENLTSTNNSSQFSGAGSNNSNGFAGVPFYDPTAGPLGSGDREGYYQSNSNSSQTSASTTGDTFNFITDENGDFVLSNSVYVDPRDQFLRLQLFGGYSGADICDPSGSLEQGEWIVENPNEHFNFDLDIPCRPKVSFDAEYNLNEPVLVSGRYRVNDDGNYVKFKFYVYKMADYVIVPVEGMPFNLHHPSYDPGGLPNKPKTLGGTYTTPGRGKIRVWWIRCTSASYCGSDNVGLSYFYWRDEPDTTETRGWIIPVPELFHPQGLEDQLGEIRFKCDSAYEGGCPELSFNYNKSRNEVRVEFVQYTTHRGLFAWRASPEYSNEFYRGSGGCTEYAEHAIKLQLDQPSGGQAEFTLATFAFECR